VPISADPVATARKLVDAGRSEGIETAVQAALDLVHYRWLTAETPGAWTNLTGSLATGDLPWSANGEIDSGAKDRLPADARRRLVATLDVVGDDHEQDEELRLFLHHVFEELLTIRLSRIGRAGTTHSTEATVARLMSTLAGRGQRILDPACGLGTSLLLSAKLPRTRIVGFEIDQRIAMTAEARFELASIDARIIASDWFMSEEGTWDAICMEPPFSMQLSQPQMDANPALAGRSVGRSDLVWVHRAVDSLSENGSAAVLLPARTLFASSDKASRQELLDRGLIEAIVALPSGASLGTGIETALWVLRGTRSPRHEGQVLLLNGAQLFVGSDDDREAEEARLSDEVLKWRVNPDYRPEPGSWRSGLVSADVLRAAPTMSPRDHLATPPTTTELRPTAPVRLLSELRLEGFKAVDSAIVVPLRPLTLVYGKNSAGKSSLIQSLLLMRQSISSPTLVTRGESFDLGSFRGLVHRHATSRPIRIGLTFGSSPAIDSPLVVPDPSLVRGLDLSFEQSLSGAARATLARITIGDEYFDFRRDHQDDLDFQLAVDDALTLVRLAASDGFAYPNRKASDNAHARLKRAFKRINATAVNLPARGSVPGDVAVVDFQLVDSALTRQGIEESDLKLGTHAAASATHELEALLGRTIHLGPLRQPPQRVSVRQDANRLETDLPFYLLDNKSERDALSKWIQRLGMNYDLDVLSLASAPGAHVLGDIASIVLTNEQTGVTLSTADVGFGISQVLPILVELSTRRDSVILIEQPEIHLHPAMQSELADLIIESTDEAGRGNQVIAETHSEHLMLRIQRRIREGQLDANQVSVIYVDQDDQGAAYATQLRLDDNGEFVDEWPNGFFSERFDEVFSGLL